MSNPRKLLRRVRSGTQRNIRFSEFVALVEAFGFELVRHGGSHHIYQHPHCEASLNLQPDRGEAKPYQVRQFMGLIEEYNLTMKESS